MENEISEVVVNVNKDSVVNESVANGESVNGNAVNNNSVNLNGNIVPEVLVELGFPSITENAYSDWWDEIVEITINFYNSIYTLKKIYEKHTSKKLKLSASIVPHRKRSYTIFLNDEEVFSCRSPNRNNNSKNLQKIVDIVKELIPLAGSFENLKREFVGVYRKEKAKIELNEIELYNRYNPYKFETEAEREEREKLIEAFKNDKELAKKEVLHIKRQISFAEQDVSTKGQIFFGRRYSKEKDAFSEKLSKFLDFNRSVITSIRIYRNLLVFELFMSRLYAIKLSKAEKQRVLNIFTLLKI